MVEPATVVARFLRATAPPKVLEFARIDESYQKADHFLVERNGTYYALEFVFGGNLSFGAVGKSKSKSTAKVSHDRAVDQRLKGVQMMGGGHDATLESTRMDSEARQHLEAFDHPTFGIDWDEGEEPDSAEEDFRKFLERQMKSWKGSHSALSVVRHEYWPTFQGMVQKAVKKKYGSSVTAYRGIHGDQAAEILDNPGKSFKVHTYSSWADSLDGARQYRGIQKKPTWVVIKASFKAKDVALAPVRLPDFVNPDILMPLATDVQHSGDELVVGPMRAVRNYKIALKTRKQR